MDRGRAGDSAASGVLPPGAATTPEQVEAQLSLALRAAPIRVFVQDAQLRYTLVRGHGIGIPFEQLLGRTDADVFPPEVAAELTALKRGVLESGTPARTVVRLPAAEGLRHYDVTVEPLRDGGGEIVGLTGGAWDITAQRRLLAEREAAEARLHALIEDAPEPYLLANSDGRYIYVNRAACALLGYSRDELLGMGAADLIPPEELPSLARARQALVPGTVSVTEWRLRHKSGAWVDVEINAKVLADGSRQGFARDITDRKRAERARERVLMIERDHRSRLQLLRDATLVISSIETLAAGGVRRVLQAISDQAKQLASADYAAIGIGTDPDRPFDPWVWSGVAPHVAAAIGAAPRARGMLGWVARRGEAIRIPELAHHHASVELPEGHPPMQAFLGVPIVRDDRSIGNLYLARRPGGSPFSEEDEAVIGLLAGHAAIAIANAQLHEERQAAVRAREEMIAVVSHDLRGPLNAIELREAHLARNQADPKLLAHTRSVRRSVAMMQRMIRGLLDASSLALGQLRIEVGAHDLGALIGEVVEVLTPIAEDRDVRIGVQLPELPPQTFDRERILQTVFNLAGNAVKFTPPGGAVTISAVLREQLLEVAVADSGPGIPAETLPRIFDRYFTTARGHEGSGLGLYIAKGLVEAHGGRLWVDSLLGRGSTFYFALPRPGAAGDDAT